MTAEALLKQLDKVGSVTRSFSFPYIKLIVSSELFKDRSESERELLLAETIGTSLDDLRKSAHNSLFLLRPVAPGEVPIFSQNRSTHWIAGLADVKAQPSTSRVRTIHFYGYKGGQSRSTVLAETALALAQDGWRVLAVDADIEAPSLNTLFSASSSSLSSTLLGLVQNVDQIRPLTVHTSSSIQGGEVGLINCWPRTSDYSIDAAAFALRTALEPSVLESALQRLATFAVEQRYDVMLVDHRTGISPSILPAIAALPGPVVVAVRMDEQWQPAKPFLKLLMQAFAGEPGLFVVWKPDSEDARSFNQRTYSQREDLLELLAESYDNADGEEPDISPSDVSDHFVVWPYDSAFRAQRLPNPETLDKSNQDALASIRSLLRLGQTKDHPTLAAPLVGTRDTSISGARDQGNLIITRALRDLLAPNNPYVYVLGRKGTGKTRIAREISLRGKGELLLTSDDTTEQSGIRSNSAEIKDAIGRHAADPERFWITLFNAAMKSPNTELLSFSKAFVGELGNNQSTAEIIAGWRAGSSLRTFLLDSLETTFPSRLMPSFLNGLFRVLSMIEGEARVADRLTFRLFLRRDLAQPGFVQNIEQQLYGKSLELSWDYQSILNFMLSRIDVNEWYRSNFGNLTDAIAEKRSLVLAGELTILQCEALLQLAFPSTVRRNNLSTNTFLRTYFADSASDRGPSDSSGGNDVRRYYPRVFDDFVREIPADLVDPNGSAIPAIENGRIHQQRIFRAHEKAAANYLEGLKQELAYLIDLSSDLGENQTKIDTILNSFEGRKTPFQISVRVRELSEATSIGADDIRSALEKMKDVGMFEIRPDYPGEWRAGRLFKSSLRMKYVRGRVGSSA